MVIGALPAGSLILLLMRSFAKPVAKTMVKQAKTHPIFRKYCLIIPGQWYHWVEVRIKFYVTRKNNFKLKRVKVNQLNETMAVALGADLLSEILIFGFGGAALIMEVKRQTDKSAAIQVRKKQEMQDLIDEKDAVENAISVQVDLIDKLEKLVEAYSQEHGHPIPEKTAPGRS